MAAPQGCMQWCGGAHGPLQRDLSQISTGLKLPAAAAQHLSSKFEQRERDTILECVSKTRLMMASQPNLAGLPSKFRQALGPLVTDTFTSGLGDHDTVMKTQAHDHMISRHHSAYGAVKRRHTYCSLLFWTSVLGVGVFVPCFGFCRLGCWVLGLSFRPF